MQFSAWRARFSAARKIWYVINPAARRSFDTWRAYCPRCQKAHANWERKRLVQEEKELVGRRGEKLHYQLKRWYAYACGFCAFERIRQEHASVSH